MLTLSQSAADWLAESRARQGIPDEAILRVAPSNADGDGQSLSLGFVTAPQQGDRTGSVHGMQICVAADVADALDGAEIDARTTGDDMELVLVPAT